MGDNNEKPVISVLTSSAANNGFGNSNGLSAPRKQTSGCGKYANALKVLLPCRRAPRNKKKMPANKAGLFSFITVNWLTKMMWKAFTKGLTQDDFFDLDDADDAAESARRLESIWGRRVGKQGAATSLGSAVWRFCRTRSLIAIVLMIISTVLQFAGPAFLQKMLLGFIEDISQPLWQGLLIVFGLFLSQLFRNLFFGMAYVINMHTATRLQGGLQHLVYNKLLRLRASDDKALGQVVTFCSSEQERMFDAVHMSSITIGSPVMFAMAVGYSVWLMGAYALIGNALILLFYPIMGVVAAVTSTVRKRTVLLTDKRINIMSEILNNIKLIKMYAWEESFADNVKDVREKERIQLQRAAFLQSFSSTISPSITILAAVATFIAYTVAGHDLESQTVFTVYSVFNALQFTVATLPYGIKCITEARVSFQKMEKFLMKPDMDSHSDQHVPKYEVGDFAIMMKSANFVWDDPAEGIANSAFEDNVKDGEQGSESLRNMNLAIKKGKLIGVCGSVGSGKTSLLSAITGDMVCVRGDMAVNGSVAIVTQQAWIFNETLRENIIFGLPFDERRYRETVEVCSLQRDLELLPKADMTEIGERGSNLSGGQKQRVNLARSVYANKDIYLLDDPLSAVDARVAKHIFNKCIKSTLANKTVMLVTHGIQFLEECDEILYMKDGVVSERGTHAELKAKNGDYAHMLSYDQNRDKEKDKKEEAVDVADLDEEPPVDVAGGTLTAAEAHKSLGFRAYIDYFRFCGGVGIMAFLFILILAFVISQLFAGLWLQIWLDMGDGNGGTSVLNNPNLTTNQLIYGISFVLMMVTGSIKGFGFARQLVLASSRMHDTMFRKVMRCPVAFFDVTPVGRILQRFSKDMDELDVRIPYYLEYVGQGMLTCIGQMVMVCIMYPIFSVVLAIAVVIFGFLEVWLNRGLQQNKSLDSIRKAPVLSHLSSTMSGLSVIRTYGRQDVQLARFRRRLNQSLASDLIYRASVRWFTFRMDMICVTLVVLTALVCVLLKESGAASASKSGLALSSVFAVCNVIPFVMQMASELQARFTSVERVLEYTAGLKEEAPRRVANGPKPGAWPTKGGVRMEEVELRYRDGLPLVLQKVNADIHGGEKIGVVGRTGAGKSSLINTLLRFQELAGGRILIDDVDIAKIGLHDLRSSIAIIPQDPVLFEGTMRFNLDPFEDFSDESIWEALEKSHIKDKVAREEKQLLTPISGGGQNLSVGEKQLICLARAVLRRNKILLLDEATASVDVETDFLIQRTIREAFHDCTVLTIAHRLHTVATYDRVMVMDAGKVIEFDTPSNLLNDTNSVFRQMSDAAGGVTVQSTASS